MENEEKAKLEQGKKEIQSQIRIYKELKKLDEAGGLDDYFKLLISTASAKMIWAFTGDNIKDWNQFCKVRGEVIAYLYPIQEVKGARAMEEHLTQQLDTFYRVD